MAEPPVRAVDPYTRAQLAQIEQALDEVRRLVRRLSARLDGEENDRPDKTEGAI